MSVRREVGASGNAVQAKLGNARKPKNGGNIEDLAGRYVPFWSGR
jgi:hypothetical protein